MTAGKSTELLRMVKADDEEGLPVAIVHTTRDTRRAGTDDRTILLHCGGSARLPRRAHVFVVDALAEIKPVAGMHVYVDELHMFDPVDASETLVAWLLRNDLCGLRVFLFGLMTETRREMWPTVRAVLPLVCALHYMHATCEQCGAKADFNAFRNKARNTEYKHGDVCPGGMDLFKTVCLACHVRG